MLSLDISSGLWKFSRAGYFFKQQLSQCSFCHQRALILLFCTSCSFRPNQLYRYFLFSHLAAAALGRWSCKQITKTKIKPRTPHFVPFPNLMPPPSTTTVGDASGKRCFIFGVRYTYYEYVSVFQERARVCISS